VRKKFDRGISSFKQKFPMKIWLCVLIVGLSTQLYAQTPHATARYVSESELLGVLSKVEASQPKSQSVAPQILEPETRYSVSVMGGVSGFQTGDITIRESWSGTKVKGSSEDNAIPFMGLRFEMEFWDPTFHFGWEDGTDLATEALKESRFLVPINTEEKIQIIPTMGVEVFYLTGEHSFQKEDGGVLYRLEANLDAICFSFNPTIKLRYKNWKPYVGGGVGGAWVEAGNARHQALGETLQLDGRDDDMAFLFQGFVGMEYQFSRRWGVFMEYKAINFTDLSFNGDIAGVDLSYRPDFWYHTLVTGVKFGF
jgi:hypothetical protein